MNFIVLKTTKLFKKVEAAGMTLQKQNKTKKAIFPQKQNQYTKWDKGGQMLNFNQLVHLFSSFFTGCYEKISGLYNFSKNSDGFFKLISNKPHAFKKASYVFCAKSLFSPRFPAFTQKLKKVRPKNSVLTFLYLLKSICFNALDYAPCICLKKLFW